MDSNLTKLLISKHLTIGSVESITAGLFASTIANTPGASKALLGAIVTYTAETKLSLLGISKSLIDKFGAVSKEVAEEMANLGKHKLNVDICVSFTGNAGPTTEKDSEEVGLVYIAIAYKNEINVYENHFKGERNQIRNSAVEFAYTKVYQLIE